MVAKKAAAEQSFPCLYLQKLATGRPEALATLCAKESDHIASFQAEVSGPYPCGEAIGLFLGQS